MQENTAILLGFMMPVPLDKDCQISIVFPLPISSNLSFIEVYGMFGAIKNLSFTINQATNTINLMNACPNYTDNSFEATLRFNNVTNPTSTAPQNGLNVLIRDVNGFMIS